MKKIITLSIISILTLFFFAGKAQVTVFSNNLETWNGNVPVGLVGAKTTVPAANVNPYTISSHSPVTSVKLENTTSTHMRFSTQPLTVINGTVYTVSFWVRGHGDIRIGLFDGRSGNGYATYGAYTTVNSTSWAQVTGTITAATDTAKAEFILSFRNTVADIDHLQVDDITITRPGTPNPTISIYSPAEGGTVYSTDVPVAFDVSEFVVGNPAPGIDGYINYKVDGGTAQSHYTILPINITGLTAGVHQVILQLVDTNGVALTPNIADTVNFTVNLTAPNPQSIYSIQYSTATPPNSPFNNTVTTTTGIVTAVATSGYFLEDSAKVWNGIYVYDNLYSPAIGDKVSVTGTVKEFHGFTEFTTITGLTVLSSGNTLPAPVIITAANIADTTVGEPYEGILVKIINVPCAKLPNNFGEWALFSGDSAHVGSLIFGYTPVLGAYYDIEGVLYLGYHNYFIEPRDINDIYSYSGINELSAASANVSMYPNPANDALFISNLSGATTITISNLIGETIKEIKVSGDDVKINVANLPSGLYVITLQDETKLIAVKKLSVK